MPLFRYSDAPNIRTVVWDLAVSYNESPIAFKRVHDLLGKGVGRRDPLSVHFDHDGIARKVTAIVFFLAGDENDVTFQKRGVAAAHVVVERRVFGEEGTEEDRERQRDQDEGGESKEGLYLDLCSTFGLSDRGADRKSGDGGHADGHQGVYGVEEYDESEGVYFHGGSVNAFLNLS